MKAWENYTNLIKRHCASPSASARDLSYWRNDLFARALICLIPLCFIAVLPGLYMCLVTKLYTLAMINIATITTIGMIALLPGIPITIRKLVFILAIYLFSWILVYYLGYLGLYGNSLLFVMACCLLFILIFPSAYAYWTLMANALICSAIALGIYFNFFGWTAHDPNALGTWISVSANLLFLSALFSLLLPRLFNGLQQTMINENKVRTKLKASKKNYSDLFNLNPLPMWVYDAETLRFLDVNAIAVRHYGYNREEFLSKTILDLNSQIALVLSVPGQEAQQIGAFPEQTCRHLKKNGMLIQVELSGRLISYKGRKAVINVVHDITERARYISTIEQQNTILRDIAWIQSHVVRAPLARMMGLITLLKDYDCSPQEQEELLKPLLESAQELDGLIRQISDKAYQIEAVSSQESA